MSNKYSKISSLAELEAAQKQLRRKLSRKEKEVTDRFYGLRDDYAPVNLLGMTLRTTETDKPLLQLIRYLRRKIASL